MPLYGAFRPAEVKRQADRLEIHDSPKRGIRLYIAEIKLSAMAGQYLDRRIAVERRVIEQHGLRDSRWLGIPHQGFREASEAFYRADQSLIDKLAGAFRLSAVEKDFEGFKRFADQEVELMSQRLGLAVVALNRAAEEYVFS